jgi:hypothetical protein
MQRLLYPRDGNSGADYTERPVGSTADMHGLEKKKNNCHAFEGFNADPSVVLLISQSLYRLRYPIALQLWNLI